MPFWLFTVATSVELSNMFAAIRALGAVMRVADSGGGYIVLLYEAITCVYLWLYFD